LSKPMIAVSPPDSTLSLPNSCIMKKHFKEALQFLKLADRTGLPIVSAAIFGSSVDSDIQKQGDLDLIVLIGEMLDARCLGIFTSCFSDHMNNVGDSTLFSHAPLVALLGGPCLFGSTAARGIIERFSLVRGHSDQLICQLMTLIEMTGDAFTIHCYWELSDVCGDLMATVAEASAQAISSAQPPRFWRRINRRIIDLAFYGLRLAIYLKEGKWLARNRDIIQEARMRLGWEWNADYRALIRSEDGLLSSDFPSRTFCILTRTLRETGLTARAHRTINELD